MAVIAGAKAGREGIIQAFPLRLLQMAARRLKPALSHIVCGRPTALAPRSAPRILLLVRVRRGGLRETCGVSVTTVHWASGSAPAWKYALQGNGLGIEGAGEDHGAIERGKLLRVFCKCGERRDRLAVPAEDARRGDGELGDNGHVRRPAALSSVCGH
jgi:hypothetical protein